ncbi:MAG: pilus assembly protein TadG-related protein [Dermatophilaceae bacterium]
MNRARTRGVGDRERGSVAVWMITTATAMVLMVGLAVDLSGQVHAKQRAQDIAAEAARAGGQQLQGAIAVRGQGAVVDPAGALAAANTYIAAAGGVSGSAAVTGGTRVVATTQTSYSTKFLSIVGITTLTVTGRAEVDVARAVGGVAG